MLSPATLAAARFSRLRELGPAFIANRGTNYIVGALTPLPPPDSWADVQRAANGGRTGGAEHGGRTGGFGAVGYLAYEAGIWAQPVAQGCPPPLPLGWLGRCESITHSPSEAPDIPLPPPKGQPPSWSSASDYERAVRTALDHIRAGDCYQVNLARRVTVPDPGDPLDVWLRLQASNPARCGMLLDTGAFSVLSNSPELLLQMAGREVLSIPIKGTRPIDQSPERLMHSAKERAELTMIVDLVRADLGSVAIPGSVRAGPRRIGRIGHLWHAMQRVRATVGPDVHAADVLRVLFPAGSVTGAPRQRATEIIARLEGAPRGAYCGTMGWFGDDGSAHWNVAIRTMTFLGPRTRPQIAEMHFGSGIVWGSDPAREREETEWKAQRMLAAVCG